jgi:hypothetical protein
MAGIQWLLKGVKNTLHGGLFVLTKFIQGCRYFFKK